MMGAGLLLAAAAVASAQSTETGTVLRIDPQSRVVMLDDGRMYRVRPNTRRWWWRTSRRSSWRSCPASAA